MYVESASHSQHVHLKRGEQIESRQTLSELLSLFTQHAKGQFITPYKGYIVNQKSIRSIEPDKLVLTSGAKVPIVRRNFKQLKDQYVSFIFEESGG